ncbi:MAG TPA: N-acetyl-gamma-glutamyl-phosphate reductase [Candidatus Hydrogenedentes bacterium]|nr:N-acetyl-gamma-glutamyl-phosphate reductase [Candidatus Hydrogenedentota bacterium]HRK35341.1 N-acetyl-gamma-glutamyl-phosphate reductase [Candidatus Hydrogenedentota bacterium]
MVIRIGIVGTGYGAREMMRLAAIHPEFTLTAVASTSAAGKALGDVLPAFRKVHDITIEAFDAAALAAKCDAVVIGVPSGQSIQIVAALREAGARVLDLGGDFRLKDVGTFEKYYKEKHGAPHLLAESVYGLAPVYRAQLKSAQLVCVPGCYPISAILPLRPILDHVKTDIPIVIDAISGISGAGRSPSEAYHFPEMNENMKAYKLGIHQHVPEIEQEIGHRAMVQFTPHVAPLSRGILTTITFRPNGSVDADKAFTSYAQEPFVRVLPKGQLPEVKHVRGSNFCDIGWVQDDRTGNLLMVSAIDNMMGGTAGMAVQCMNIMFGFDERTGLSMAGIAP